MAFNMDPKKCPMPTQDPNVRNKNFEEVALGYTEEMAVNEAKRCIHCKNKPCQTGCPVGIDIPEFIGHVAEGDFEAAYQVIARSSSLPAVCGRVCPQENQCEGQCIRGIKGEPGVFDNEPGWDAARKGDIDFEAIRHNGEERGRRCYREVAAKCGGTIPRPEIMWDTLLHDKRYADLSIEEKRTMYHAQEAIKIWDAAGFDAPIVGPKIEDFQCTEDEYAARRANRAFVPYAVIQDCEWYARGEMGWWGVTTNECSEDEWNAKVWKIVNALPDDTLISFYDCHI